ncbi:hypothetical protein [Butyrivibrio sp. AE3009]|uniref:hypothetical protein n=1 Tax=Butyrivibrio sp. AE3009 TaxID=1280666 RepID=UPI0003B57D69|nr:hypothetical protein [Butyrivibrio sp. AE3009]
MKKFSRRVLVLVLMPLILLTAMGSRSISFTSYAAESAETTKVVNGLHDAVYENNGEKSDVCFYIRGNGVGGDIPVEPGSYPRTDYSDPIRINGIASHTDLVSEGGSEDNLLQDGFTAANEVTASLDRVPTADEIKSVVGEFDSDQHYVIWYVIKTASTLAPNQDVKIHVDGVIRIKEKSEPANPEEPEPSEPSEPSEPTEPSEPAPSEPVPSEPAPTDPEPTDPEPTDPEPTDPEPSDPAPTDPEKPEPEQPVEPEVVFSIQTVAPSAELQYDGKEHVVGGYVIRLENLKNPGESLVRYYGPYGDPISEDKSSSDEAGLMAGDGDAARQAREQTVISFLGTTYTVNVGGAYTTVKEPLNYTIPFMSGSNVVAPGDIVLYDSNGKKIGGEVKTLSSNGNVKVTQRKITIKAGSTVKNDDGSTITNNEVTITKGSLLKGHKLTDVVFNGSQTGVGSSVNEITSFRIVDEKGKDVSGYYSVTRINGKLVLVDGSSGRKDSESPLPGTTGKAEPSADRTLGKRGTVSGTILPEKLGAGNEIDATLQVLGARRSETSDDSRLYMRVLMIILAACIIAAGVPAGKNPLKNKFINY